MRILFFALLLIVSSCSSLPEKRVTHFRGFAHALPYEIQIGHALSPKEKKEVKGLIDETFLIIDQIYNHWNPVSELSYINRAPQGEEIALSPALSRLLLFSKEISLLTKGKFDPTLGTVIEEWKTALPSGGVPSFQDLNLLEAGWEAFTFLSPYLVKKGGGATLDLDGILKGYAVDSLFEALAKRGYVPCSVNWAGDLRVLGPHPSLRPWQILLPDEATLISLEEGALATSGDYEQYWTFDETTYSHIVDPQTKKAIVRKENSIAFVTIYAPSCALADALATACMTFSDPEKALLLMTRLKEEKFPSLQCWIFGYGGKLLILK